MKQVFPRVLIVEDSGFFRRALAMNLSNSGFEVFTAANGSDALGEVTAHKPNVIVLDMFMPKLDGMMVLRVLRSNPDTATVPVILLSAGTKEEDVLMARTLGSVEYLSKASMDFYDLVYMIQSHGTRHMQINNLGPRDSAPLCAGNLHIERRVQ